MKCLAENVLPCSGYDQEERPGTGDARLCANPGLDVAGRLCGLGDDPRIMRVRKKRSPLLDLLNETTARLKDPAAILSSPRLLYLFR